MQENGLLITIEGYETAELVTQTKLLAERLRSNTHDVVIYEFPRYQSDASYFLRQYEANKYTQHQLGPYTPAIFYSFDHFDAENSIKQDLRENKIVLCSNYIFSNMARQALNFEHEPQRQELYTWLGSLEFNMLGITPPDVSLSLCDTGTVEHSGSDKNIFKELQLQFPKIIQIIARYNGDTEVSVPGMHTEIWERIQPMLRKYRKNNSNSSKSAHEVFAPKKLASDVVQKNYFIPETFDETTKLHFIDQINTLLEKQMLLLEQLNKNVASKDSKVQNNAAQVIADLVLPIATDTDQLSGFPLSSIEKIVANASLQPMKGDDKQSLKLIGYLPKNELDLVPEILYSYSSLGFQELKSTTDQWSYKDKEFVLKKYFHESQKDTNQSLSIQYRFDILSNYQTFHQFKNNKYKLQQQELTPHYGFETPELVSEAGLDELFESCFEISLQLYHFLVAHDYHQEAQYAVLRGHKLRWNIDLTIYDVYRLNSREDLSQTKSYKKLVSQMQRKISETHPLIAEGMRFISEDTNI